MFASIILLSSLVFSAFFLAFFLFIDAFTFNRSTFILLTLTCQDESAARLSAYIAHNQPCDIESSDLEYLGGDAESQPATPHIVASRPWDDSDTALAREWDGYQRFRALNAHYPQVIRPDAAHTANTEESAFKADNPEYDDWFPRWCGATT